MSVGAADLAKAINAAWDASTLDATFRALWSDPASSEFTVLNDEEAAPSQHWPYVVMEQTAGTTRARMSGTAAANQEIRDVPVVFRVHARAVDGDDRDAKEIAATLVEELLKVFGGHPTEAAGAMTLDNGNYLITQYQTDYPTRTGEDEWQWTISYICRLDVPVAA